MLRNNQLVSNDYSDSQLKSEMQTNILDVLLFLQLESRGFVFWALVWCDGGFPKLPRVNIHFAPLISSLGFLPCTKETAPDPTSKWITMVMSTNMQNSGVCGETGESSTGVKNHIK